MHEFKNLHQDVIMDCVEISFPLLIATACIDKNIRLISLSEKKVMGIFMGHSKGVRQLHYTPYQEGYMVSASFERIANIWSFDGGIGAI